MSDFCKLQQGMSLLELLLAAALGLMLLSGLTVLYVSLKTNYSLQQAYIHSAESIRLTNHLFTQRLQMAGFAACQSASEPVMEQAIIGYDSDHLPAEWQDQVKAGTDMLIIASCENNTSLSQDLQLTQMAYFIGDSNRLNSQGEKIYSLYQKPLTGDRQELVEGMADLQLQYGILAPESNYITNYVVASTVKDWGRVGAVQLDGLINSVEPVLTKPQPYYFGQQLVWPQDHLLHQYWSSYIALRERLDTG